METAEFDYTLWRGGVRLGRVRIEFPFNGEGFAGMLEVEPAFSDIEELIQVTQSEFSGSPVFISLMRDAHKGPGPVALRELSTEEARGAPPERVFEVRDATGARLETAMISISSMQDPMPERGELFDVCKARGVPISRWHVLVTRPESRMKLLPDGWFIIVGDEGRKLTEELRRELHPSHQLYGRPLCAIARRHTEDDVLFGFERDDETVFCVHLSWSPESGPEWPATQAFRSVNEFRERWSPE